MFGRSLAVVLPMIAAALLFGGIAEFRIKRSRGSLRGRRLAQLALVLGIMNLLQVMATPRFFLWRQVGAETRALQTLHRAEARYRAQWMTADADFCDEPPEPGPNGLMGCLASIQKVRGKVVGFTDPTSTSGYLFPALQLLDAGIDPEEDIQSVFVGSHDAAVIALLNGDVEIAAAYDDARTYILKDHRAGKKLDDDLFVFEPPDGVEVIDRRPQAPSP